MLFSYVKKFLIEIVFLEFKVTIGPVDNVNNYKYKRLYESKNGYKGQEENEDTMPECREVVIRVIPHTHVLPPNKEKENENNGNNIY